VARIRDDAIVLRRWDWSETSQATLLFCRKHGLLRGLAKGAKREKGAFSGGLEPLTLGEVGAIVKASTELATLTDWDLREVFRGCRSTSRGFLAGHYIADAIRSSVHDADPHEGLWDATVAALRGFADAGAIERQLAQFQWALLVQTGYRPDLTLAAGESRQTNADDVRGSPSKAIPATWAYDPARGALVNAASISGRDSVWRIRNQTVGGLRAIADAREPSSPIKPESLERINRFLASCIAWSLGRTPPTMERLFGPLVLGSSDSAHRAPGGADR